MDSILALVIAIIVIVIIVSIVLIIQYKKPSTTSPTKPSTTSSTKPNIITTNISIRDIKPSIIKTTNTISSVKSNTPIPFLKKIMSASIVQPITPVLITPVPLPVSKITTLSNSNNIIALNSISPSDTMPLDVLKSDMSPYQYNIDMSSPLGISAIALPYGFVVPFNMYVVISAIPLTNGIILVPGMVISGPLLPDGLQIPHDKVLAPGSTVPIGTILLPNKTWLFAGMTLPINIMVQQGVLGINNSLETTTVTSTLPVLPDGIPIVPIMPSDNNILLPTIPSMVVPLGIRPNSKRDYYKKQLRLNDTNFCIDLPNPDGTNTVDVQMMPCIDEIQTQKWSYSPTTKLISNATNNKCLYTYDSYDSIGVINCKASDARQRWTMYGNNSFSSATGPSSCLSANSTAYGSVMHTNACLNETLNKFEFGL